MFDDPRGKLYWMEEELLSEEEDGESEYDEIFEDFGEEFAEADPDGQFLRELNDLLGDEEEPLPRSRSRAVEYPRTVFADETFDESTAVLVEKRHSKQRLPKNKRIRGLVILACLEILGIFAVIGWWLRWLI